MFALLFIIFTYYITQVTVVFQELFDQLNIAILNGVVILKRGISQKLV